MFIQIRGVSKSFRKGDTRIVALDRVDLTIEAGEFVALMGPSGSGKTTLLNLLGGLDQPDGGEIIIGGRAQARGQDHTLARWRAETVGFLFQFHNLLPFLTAEENVELPLLLTPLSRAERRARVHSALTVVGLQDRKSHRPSELSGGQEQRVALARAIVGDPQLLLCDEPTGDLDRASADGVLDLLRALQTRLGKTIVMVTHDLEAAAKADRRIALQKGSLMEETAPTPRAAAGGEG
jgi:putative ABC transport system ATP-binding protein